MISEDCFSDNYLYPNRIVATLSALGICDEEKSLIEQYLWTTYKGESFDF